jgi:hypothetical protein
MADRVAPDEGGRLAPAQPARQAEPATPPEKTALPYGLSVSEALMILLLAVLPGRRPARPAK